jgi:hypothetical protein
VYRRTLLAAGLLLAAVTACDPAPTTSSTPPPAAAPPASTPAAAGQSPAAAAKTADLPNFVGMGLQAAQDKAQAAGFFGLHSHDALGRSRSQIDDRNWKVCAQSPAAGQQAANVTVDMGAVKLDEECPTQDQGAATPKAGAAMPDVKGKAVSAVRDMLPSNTSFQIKDATQGRAVLVESNWQVCAQDPVAGTALRGQPVSLKVVKFGETCP